MKKYTFGIVALLFSLVLLAGCTTGTNGNPSELTGTWNGSTSSGDSVSTDSGTGTYTLVIGDDGAYTYTSVTVEKYVLITTYVTKTTTYTETGSLTGSVSGDQKYVTFDKTGFTRTVSYSPVSSGTASSTTDTSKSSKTYQYYLSGTKLVIYSDTQNGISSWPTFTKSN